MQKFPPIIFDGPFFDHESSNPKNVEKMVLNEHKRDINGRNLAILKEVEDIGNVDKWQDQQFADNIPFIWHTQTGKRGLDVLGGNYAPKKIESPDTRQSQSQNQQMGNIILNTQEVATEDGNNESSLDKAERKKWAIENYADVCRRAIGFAIKYASDVDNKTAQKIIDGTQETDAKMPKLAQEVLELMKNTPFLSKRTQKTEES